MSRRSRIPLCRLFIWKSQTNNFSSSRNLVKPIQSRRILDSALISKHEFSSLPAADNFHISHPMWSNLQFVTIQCLRRYSGGSGNSEAEFDQVREVDMINLKFAEAREEIETAMESKETVYFNEEAECARDAVKEVLEMYDRLLEKLPESERKALQRSMGLKIEQLKAELKQLDE